jgi:hypothetical protein
MIIFRAIDPIPAVTTWVRIRVGEVPWSGIVIIIIIIPVRSISGVI